MLKIVQCVCLCDVVVVQVDGCCVCVCCLCCHVYVEYHDSVVVVDMLFASACVVLLFVV